MVVIEESLHSEVATDIANAYPATMELPAP